MLNIEVDDLFAIRRNNSGAGNPYDIESLITGAEVAAGLTYHDKRGVSDVVAASKLQTIKLTREAFEGKLTTAEIVTFFPRQKHANV